MADSEHSTVVPRIYVACLACYNRGRLHGDWFDVGTDPDELHHEVMGYFATGCETCGEYEAECPECRAFAAPFPCGGEELAIHDHEGLGKVDALVEDAIPVAVQTVYTRGDCSASQFESAGSCTTCSGIADVSGAANVRLIRADLLQRRLSASLATNAPPATAKTHLPERGGLRLPYLSARALIDPQEPLESGREHPR